MAKIHFREHRGTKRKTQPIIVVEDSAVPQVGDYVSIRGQTWTVRYLTWSVEGADDAWGPVLHADVGVVRME
jgi:hypothetical protein